MAGDALELIVRFAGTLLVARRMQRHERYLIGTAAGVDLPLDIAPLTKFPLVDVGLVVRAPIGVATICDGARTELTFGLVTITITRVTDRPVIVPRPRISRRLASYALVMLALHVAIVVLAMWTAAPEPITIPMRAETRRVPMKQLPVTRAVKQQPIITASGARGDVPADIVPAQPNARPGEAAGFLGSAGLEDLSMITGSKDLAKELADLGPVYDELAANARGFGNSAGTFDPANDPAFDSVKTGRYATGGGRTGANYRLPPRGRFREVERPPIMGLTCDDGLCTTVGSLDRFTVRDHVEKHYVDMVKCFERHARGAPRIELTLHFEIAANGTPSEVHATTDKREFGRCLVHLVERVKFPVDKPTQVTYPVAFWRT